MVTVRLSRAGTKKLPFYRVVVTNSRSPRDGKFLETIGTWDPCAGEGKLVLDQARFDHWVNLGATTSELVGKIVARHAKAAGAAETKKS